MRFLTVLSLLLCLGACERPRQYTMTVPPCRAWSWPLGVYLDPSVVETRPALEHAMLEWEAALDADVFRWEENEVAADIVVSRAPRRPEADPNEVAAAGHLCDGGRLRGIFEIHEYLDAVSGAYIGVHEFGHLLGVDHSSNPESVMFTRLTTGLMDGNWDDDPTWYRITRVDRDLALAWQRAPRAGRACHVSYALVP